jgi:hypothetical protein
MVSSCCGYGKRSKKGLSFRITCHREFHHDSQGLDGSTDAVFHYECIILSWIVRPKIAVLLPSGTRNLQGTWIKR